MAQKYKMKTHSGAKKRFRKTAKGKIKRGSAFRSHIMTKFSKKRVRKLRGVKYVHESDQKRIEQLLPY